MIPGGEPDGPAPLIRMILKSAALPTENRRRPRAAPMLRTDV